MVIGESPADVLIGMSCIFLQQFKMEADEPLLAAYSARCSARPAFATRHGNRSGGLIR